MAYPVITFTSVYLRYLSSKKPMVCRLAIRHIHEGIQRPDHQVLF